MLVLDGPDHPLPERYRLCVRVVYPENLYSLPDPKQHDVAQLVPKTLPVLGLEVHIHDILVLFRGVLSVPDRAVRPELEPLGVLFYVRMVGGTLDREVQSHLHPVLLDRLAEVPEVLQRAEFGVDRLVAALLAADGVGAAGVAGTGGSG